MNSRRLMTALKPRTIPYRIVGWRVLHYSKFGWWTSDLGQDRSSGDVRVSSAFASIAITLFCLKFDSDRLFSCYAGQ
jgi:hypothetical protein